jgi:DNA-binding transcriptional regulator YdaS (Cro superfamily)
MKLQKWIRAERGRGASLARTLDVPRQLVGDWSAGRREVPLEVAMRIEVETHGAVRLEDTRPDLRRFFRFCARRAPVQRPAALVE